MPGWQKFGHSINHFRKEKDSVYVSGTYFLLMLFGHDSFFATQQLAFTTKKLSLQNFEKTEKHSLKIVWRAKVLLFTFLVCVRNNWQWMVEVLLVFTAKKLQERWKGFYPGFGS